MTISWGVVSAARNADGGMTYLPLFGNQHPVTKSRHEGAWSMALEIANLGRIASSSMPLVELTVMAYAIVGHSADSFISKVKKSKLPHRKSGKEINKGVRLTESLWNRRKP